MARGIKTGGRKKGSLNKATRTRRAVAESIAQGLAQLDRNGKSMAELQIESARSIWDLAEQERAKAEPQQEVVIRLMTAACKIAKDVSQYLYPSLQAIRVGGEDDLPPIRLESLSDYQLEMLIKRLRAGSTQIRDGLFRTTEGGDRMAGGSAFLMSRQHTSPTCPRPGSRKNIGQLGKPW